MTLYELTGSLLELLEVAENGEIDKDILKDTLEAIEGEIEFKADGYAKVIKELEGRSEMLGNEADRLLARKSAIDKNIKSMKEHLQKSMIATGKTKFKTELFSFNIQKNPASLVIDNPKAIPMDLLIPQEPKINNTAIKEMLKDGLTLDYAHLESSESLRIR